MPEAFFVKKRSLVHLFSSSLVAILMINRIDEPVRNTKTDNEQRMLLFSLKSITSFNNCLRYETLDMRYETKVGSGNYGSI